MSKFNYLSQCEDCSEMVDFLLGCGDKGLVIYDHEIEPTTTLIYNGYNFDFNYNKDLFARIELKNFKDDKESIVALECLGSIISRIIGNSVAYYEANYIENGVECLNPTLEWCLKKEIVDDYVSAIVNNELFDEVKCQNVKLFGELGIDNYRKSSQLLVKKY